MRETGKYAVKEIRRKAFTLIEIILVLAVAGAMMAVIYKIYSKVQTSEKINNAVSIVRTVTAVVENARANNGNVYPAVTGDISSTEPFTYYLGNIKADVTGITYDCAAGADSTITITFPNSLTETEDICNAVAANINSSTKWQATCSGPQLTITRSNVICQ